MQILCKMLFDYGNFIRCKVAFKYDLMRMFHYCETHKTENTRIIYGMLLCCEDKANKAWKN